jgi:hypothetical protein
MVRVPGRGRAKEEMGMADATSAPAAAETARELSPKDEVRALLDRLPDTVTLEDIQYHLGVVVKVLRAEERADREGWIPHEEMKRRAAAWFDR